MTWFHQVGTIESHLKFPGHARSTATRLLSSLFKTDIDQKTILAVTNVPVESVTSTIVTIYPINDHLVRRKNFAPKVVTITYKIRKLMLIPT